MEKIIIEDDTLRALADKLMESEEVLSRLAKLFAKELNTAAQQASHHRFAFWRAANNTYGLDSSIQYTLFPDYIIRLTKEDEDEVDG